MKKKDSSLSSDKLQHMISEQLEKSLAQILPPVLQKMVTDIVESTVEQMIKARFVNQSEEPKCEEIVDEQLMLPFDLEEPLDFMMLPPIEVPEEFFPDEPFELPAEAFLPLEAFLPPDFSSPEPIAKFKMHNGQLKRIIRYKPKNDE